MDKNKTLRISSWNSGHKNRPLKANNDRKTKEHVCTPLISPIPDCHKEPVSLDNHLRSTHKVYDKDGFKQLMTYLRINFMPDSLNSLPAKEENEL